MTVRIALIHALIHSIEPINAAFDQIWPDCTRMNLLDDSLSADLAANPAGLDDAMTERFLTLSKYAIGTGAGGILFTCSAFGPCIDAVKRTWPGLPVLKPNEAMIDDAVAVARAGRRRIAVLATFAPTLASMPPEFPSDIDVVPMHVADAMEALNARDVEAHDRLVAAAAGRVRDVDAIALAQFSMARALRSAQAATALPILTTPASAVRALRQRLDANA
jgi:hypothetical protein